MLGVPVTLLVTEGVPVVVPVVLLVLLGVGVLVGV